MRRQLVWSVLLLLIGVAFAGAQETTTGSIAGQVVDAQGAPVPGATVTLSSNQGSKTFVTDGQGRFFAPYLTPGTYSVRAELAGFSPVEQKNVTVRLGQRVELSGLVLKVGGVEEVVEVVGAVPVIDTSSTTGGAVLDSESLKRIPVGRNFTDTLYLVAGVSSSGGVGRANPSVAGASGLDNSYIVDGVNITNSGYGAVGSYSIVFGSLGTGVTTDFIKETQVKTGGFEAEYGESSGGVVSVVTQSGSNDFHGSVYGYLRPTQLESSYKQLQTVNGTVNTTGQRNADFGISVGGPLLKDRLFLFGAFNPQYQSRTFVAPDGFPLRSLGGVDRKRRSLSYAGKVTWQASSNHRVDFSAFGDPSHGDMGPQRNDALLKPTTTGFSELKKYGGHNQVVKYDGILSRSWLIEASVARAKNTIVEVPSVDTWSVRDSTVSPAVLSGGIGFYEQGNDGTNTQYQIKSTNIFDAAGNHQIRYGASFEDIKYNNTNQRTGPTFTLPNGVQTKTGAQITILPDPVFGRIYRVTRANYENVRNTTQKYLSFFLQDTWQMGKRLTFRPGVRYEQQKLVGSANNPLCHADDTRPGEGNGTGPLIPCTIKWDNNFSPRVGLTYDPTGNGKAKIYGSFGRFYVKIPNDLAVRALAADAGVSRADYFDANLTQPVPAGTPAAGATTHLIVAGAGASIIDPKAKITYSQEFSGGFEYEAARSLNLGVRYVHRTIPRVLEDSSAYPLAAYDLGLVPNGGNVEYTITNIAKGNPAVPHIPGLTDASFENPVHKYDAVEVTANKSFSNNWQLFASYRWSKLQGNFEGFFRNDNGQSDPAITSLFDFPTNDPSYTQVGVPQFGYEGDIRFQGCSLGCGILPNDRTHQFKLYTSYTWNSLNVGLGFNAGSGRPLTGLFANPNYANEGEIPDSVRGSGIQTVDGFKKRSPFETTVDLSADYSVKFGGRRVVLLASVFNVFNRQSPLDYDNFHDRGFGTPNPNFGQPTNGGDNAFPGFQTPRNIRLGARFEW